MQISISPSKLKTWKNEEGTLGYVEAVGVLFTDPDNPDLDNEYFNAKTDFGPAGGNGVAATLNHRQPIYTADNGANEVLRTVARSKFTHPIKAEVSDLGLVGSHVLDLADDFENWVFEHAEKGAFRWSTGTSDHMMHRQPAEKNAKGEYATHIDEWHIIEWAYTPTPAEPNLPKISPVKSLQNLNLDIRSTPDLSQEAASKTAGDSDGDDSGSTGEPAGQTITVTRTQPTIKILDSESTREDQPMSDEQNEVTRDDLDQLMKLAGENSKAIQTVVAQLQDSGPLKDAGYIAPDSETDHPESKSLGDFLIAVSSGNHKRLNTVYGSHYNDGKSVKGHTSNDGQSLGYLIPEEQRAPIERMISLNSGILGLVADFPVGSPSGSMPFDDFSTAPAAGTGETAESSGIGTNRRDEASAYTEETGKVNQLRWNVSDHASGYVKASRELRRFSAVIERFLMRKISISVGAKREYAILRGSGAGEPLGVLNWTGSLGITPDSDNTFAVADADEMLSRFLQVGGSPVWVIHPGIIPDISAMERGTGAGTFQSDISQALATTLHGFPIVRSQHLPQDDNSGCVLLADFSAYADFQYGGMYVDFSEHADFLNGNDVWRFGELNDGKPSLDGAVTLADPQGSYTMSPFVYLND